MIIYSVFLWIEVKALITDDLDDSAVLQYCQSMGCLD